jgi:predicted dehydrogenase
MQWDHHAGTPHTIHYQNAVDAIKAGKHVLVEKSATTNAEDFRSLVDLAAKHGVFLMEAMWTRFQPIALAIKRVIDEGRIGAPVLVHADLSVDFDIDSEFSPTVSLMSHPHVCSYRPAVNAPHPRSKSRRRSTL